MPLALGADIVVHSMTKFLNGHSDCTGGAVISQHALSKRKKSISCNVRRARAWRPWICYLVSRGVKTLAVRMDRHNSNGMAVAKHLASHPQSKKCDLSGPRVASPA